MPRSNAPPQPLTCPCPPLQGGQSAAGAAQQPGGADGGGSSGRSDDGGGAGPSGAGAGPGDRCASVTLASDLLGMPSLPQNYSAKVGFPAARLTDVMLGDAVLADGAVLSTPSQQTERLQSQELLELPNLHYSLYCVKVSRHSSIFCRTWMLLGVMRGWATWTTGPSSWRCRTWASCRTTLQTTSSAPPAAPASLPTGAFRPLHTVPACRFAALWHYQST